MNANTKRLLGWHRRSMETRTVKQAHPVSKFDICVRTIAGTRIVRISV